MRARLKNGRRAQPGESAHTQSAPARAAEAGAAANRRWGPRVGVLDQAFLAYSMRWCCYGTRFATDTATMCKASRLSRKVDDFQDTGPIGGTGLRLKSPPVVARTSLSSKVRESQHHVARSVAAARARGRMGGRPKKPNTDTKIVMARRLHADKSNSIADICKTLGVSRATLYRYLEVDEASSKPATREEVEAAP